MKKSIQQLIGKLGTDPEGKLKGGFTSIKGGFAMLVKKTNDFGTDCSNSMVCDANNINRCANSGSCTDTSNFGTCTNTGICLM